MIECENLNQEEIIKELVSQSQISFQTHLQEYSVGLFYTPFWSLRNDFPYCVTFGSREKSYSWYNLPSYESKKWQQCNRPFIISTGKNNFLIILFFSQFLI